MGRNSGDRAVARRLSREAATYVVGLFLAGAFQFASVPVYTRTMAPVDYSLLALSMVITFAAAGILVVGGELALSRFWFMSDDPTWLRRLTSTWVAFLTTWSIIVVAALVCLSPLIGSWFSEQGDLVPLLRIGFVTLVPAQLSRLLAQVLRNQFHARTYAISQVAVAALGLLLGVVLVVGVGLGPAGALLGLLVAETSVCLLRLGWTWRTLRGPLELGLLRPLLAFGLPFVPLTAASWVFVGADRVAVAKFQSASELAAYAAVAVLVTPFLVTATALAQAWVPRITQTFERPEGDARPIIAWSIEASLIGFGAGALALAPAGEWLLVVISGPDYAIGGISVPFLALAAAFSSAAVFSRTGAMLARRTGHLSVMTVAAAILAVALLVVLVPLWSIAGAALAMALASLATYTGYLVASQRQVHVSVNLPRQFLVVCVLLGAGAVSTTLHGTIWAWVCSALALGVLAAASKPLWRRALWQEAMHRDG